MNEKDKILITHIVAAIDKIEEYTYDIDENTFMRNTLIEDAVIRQIMIIGEAARHVSKEIVHQFPAVPWKDIVGMRDKLIHGYFGVDTIAVWKTVQEDIPQLKVQFKKIWR